MKGIILLLIVIAAYAAKDLYKILGVKKTATPKEIKKAFKKLAIRFHPDRIKGGEKEKEKGKQKFIEISNAYEILSDEKKRKTYDKYGMEGVKNQEQQEAQGGSGHGGFHGGSFEDMFSQFFGNQGGRGHRGHGGFNQFFDEEDEDLSTDEFNNTDIVELNMKSLSSLYRRNENWFVLFYKITDSSFKSNVTLWKTLSEKVYGIFKTAAVNCGTEEEICEEFIVRSTPLFVYFPEASDNEEVYKGEKKWEAFLKHVSVRMQSFVQVLNPKNYDDFLSSSPTNHKIIFFTNRKSTSPLLKAISKHYRGKLEFGEIRASEAELVSKFAVKSFPTILALTDPSNNTGEVYEGQMSKDFINKFLNKFAYQKLQVEKKPEFKELNAHSFHKLNNCNTSDSKSICLIVLTKEDNLSQTVKEKLTQLAKRYLNDPIRVYYTVKENSQVLGDSLSGDHSDSEAIVLRGKRRRYFPIEEASFETVSKVVDNILSGTGKSFRLAKRIDFESVQKDEL